MSAHGRQLWGSCRGPCRSGPAQGVSGSPSRHVTPPLGDVTPLCEVIRLQNRKRGRKRLHPSRRKSREVGTRRGWEARASRPQPRADTGSSAQEQHSQQGTMAGDAFRGEGKPRPPCPLPDPGASPHLSPLTPKLGSQATGPTGPVPKHRARCTSQGGRDGGKAKTLERRHCGQHTGRTLLCLRRHHG